MSELRSCQSPEEASAFLSRLFSDPEWSPPSYRFLSATLDVVAVVNRCTVLDEDDALDLFPSIPDAVFVAKMDDERRNMKMLPWKYDPKTNTVEPFGKDADVSSS